MVIFRNIWGDEENFCMSWKLLGEKITHRLIQNSLIYENTRKNLNVNQICSDSSEKFLSDVFVEFPFILLFPWFFRFLRLNVPSLVLLTNQDGVFGVRMWNGTT